ncbi:hypothetical protein DWY47_10720, partial [Ruminococcus sp. AF25-23LB]
QKTDNGKCRVEEDIFTYRNYPDILLEDLKRNPEMLEEGIILTDAYKKQIMESAEWKKIFLHTEIIRIFF